MNYRSQSSPALPTLPFPSSNSSSYLPSSSTAMMMMMSPPAQQTSFTTQQPMQQASIVDVDTSLTVDRLLSMGYSLADVRNAKARRSRRDELTATSLPTTPVQTQKKSVMLASPVIHSPMMQQQASSLQKRKLAGFTNGTSASTSLMQMISIGSSQQQSCWAFQQQQQQDEPARKRRMTYVTVPQQQQQLQYSSSMPTLGAQHTELIAPSSTTNDDILQVISDIVQTTASDELFRL